MASSSSAIAAAQPENESRGTFHGIATSASTSSPSKRSVKPCYDVFINHRGPDVKHTLASVLYGVLNAMSLSVFLDSQETEYGDLLLQTIEAAMASALVHIAIFSKGYADSPWCLAELAFMLKSGAEIIPIFYHVDPSDLRWVDQGKGIYFQSFERHQRKGRYSSEQLEEWKITLHNVSLRHGQIIESDEDEKRLLKNIVSCVLKEIHDSVSLEVAKYPVGMKEIVEDFKANTIKSDHGNLDVQIVGIWGMGGAGKTTLAKALYNEMSSSMLRSSIVFNVRNAATKGLLHEKQKKLLNDFGIQGLTFDNIEDGKRSLSRGMRSIRALIILDDVDNTEQLDALLPTKDSLQKGSFIIVTTRIYEVLRRWGISLVYQMKPLNPSYAMQLFCWHAFLKSYRPDEFKEVVEKFLTLCNGLPLSLKVLGAQLYGKSRKEYWESQLDKVMRILPEDIEEILKTSYDTLDNEEKEMFLDAASFFIGEESSLAIEVWNGMGWSGLQSWERLLNRCMVELDNDNCIKMHDHLRDLGKSITGKQLSSPRWLPQQINDIHQQKEKSIGIRGIVTTSNQISQQYSWEKYKAPYMTKPYGEIDNFRVYCSKGKLMVNSNGKIWSPATTLVGLKYLVIRKDFFNVVGEVSREQGCLHWFRSIFNQPLDELPREPLGEISRELVWLRWFEIPHRNLPVGLSLQKLRVLELFEEEDCYNSESHHHLEELWGETENEVPLQLRQLLISHCYEFQGLPKSMGRLNHLKKIVIVKSPKFSSLPDEFCLLKSLEHLVLYKCYNLSSLPRNFGNLGNLRHLCLANCCKLKRLPISFKNLTLLKHLNLMRCSELTFTSEDLNCLENIKGLEFLNFDYCERVEELPRHMTNQVSLRELSLSCKRLRELPDNIGQLRRLNEMKISDALFTSFPISFGDLASLRELYICHCSRLERFPDSLGDLSSLTNLQIYDCPKLNAVPKSIMQLNNIQELTRSYCPISELNLGVASLSFFLSNLKNIELISTDLCRISLAEDSCPSLESLLVSENHHLKEIEELPRSLKTISLGGCEMLKTIPSFAELTSLTKFSLTGNCSGIQKIEGLENCTSLKSLILESCWEAPGIESLEYMHNLKSLELKANKRSVIERCIQRMQISPDRITICARAVPDAASLLHSLLTPNLSIIEEPFFMEERPRELKINSNGDDSSIFCFLLNCVSAEIKFWDGIHWLKVGKGRWVLVGVVTKYSSTCLEAEFGEEEGMVEVGLVGRGIEQTAVETLRSLLPLLES